MTVLTKTLMGILREDKKEVIKALETNKSIDCTIQLQKEPGEILMPLCMEKEEMEDSVNKAVHFLFPGCKASSVKIIDDTISFKIE